MGDKMRLKGALRQNTPSTLHTINLDSDITSPYINGATFERHHLSARAFEIRQSIDAKDEPPLPGLHAFVHD